MFTQKHYEQIAHTLADCQPPITEIEARRAHYGICIALVKMFEANDSKFVVGKFLNACGWGE